MQNKGLYILIGILIGIIIVLALVKMPGQPLYAVDPDTSGGASEGVVALTTNTVRTQATILWVVDVRKSNILVYEYANDNTIQLKAFRDIGYDLNVPDGYAGFGVSRGQDPRDVKKAYEKAKKELDKGKKPKK